MSNSKIDNKNNDDDLFKAAAGFENYLRDYNAKFLFNEFTKAIETEAGLTEEVNKLFGMIDNIVLGKEKKKFVKELKKGEQYYRARIINEEDYGVSTKGTEINSEGEMSGYNDSNSREPLLGISGAGRNNIPGASYLYIASDPATACMEVKSHFGQLISLATFELNETLKIIDFSTDKEIDRSNGDSHQINLGTFFTKIMMKYMIPIRDESMYKVTQNISDYLRKSGIDGIAYKSSLTPKGINYTIFNSHPHKISFVESKVLIHKQANHSFWYLNEEGELMSNKGGELMTWDKDIVNSHKKQLLESKGK